MTGKSRDKGSNENEKCCLCDRLCNLEHILSSCNIALTQGRYRLRHNKVLEEFAHRIELKCLLANKAPKVKENQIQFVKAGQNHKKEIPTKSDRRFSQCHRSRGQS